MTENSIAARQTADEIVSMIVESGTAHAAEFADGITSAIQGALDRSNEFWKMQEKIAADLRAAILKHREQTNGHGMCWENDRELWDVVAPGNSFREPPPWPEFMSRCAAYRASRERDSVPTMTVLPSMKPGDQVRCPHGAIVKILSTDRAGQPITVDGCSECWAERNS